MSRSCEGADGLPQVLAFGPWGGCRCFYEMCLQCFEPAGDCLWRVQIFGGKKMSCSRQLHHMWHGFPSCVTHPVIRSSISILFFIWCFRTVKHQQLFRLTSSCSALMEEMCSKKSQSIKWCCACWESLVFWSDGIKWRWFWSWKHNMGPELLLRGASFCSSFL